MKKRLHITPWAVVCPACLEPLTRDDIDGFGRCPYCNHRFEATQELEDFLLRPVVRQWVRQAQHADDQSV